MIRYAFKCSLKFDQDLQKFDNNKIFNAKAFFAGGAWHNRGAYDTLALSLTLPHFPSISRNHL